VTSAFEGRAGVACGHVELAVAVPAHDRRRLDDTQPTNQHAVTEYLIAENAVLREQLRGRRIRYTDAQRRKLARAAKKLGRKGLSMLDTLVTPRTLLGWSPPVCL
jgi:hypothetical protein